jgi:hypothetical protein
MRQLLSIAISVLTLAAPVLPALVARAAAAEPGAPACNACRDTLATMAPDTRVSLVLRDGSELRCDFVTLMADTLVLCESHAHRHGKLQLRPLAEVRSLRLEEKRSRGAVLAFCLLGAVAGGLIGGHAGQEAVKGGSVLSSGYDLTTPIVMPIVGTIVGAVLGGMVGVVVDEVAAGSPGPALLCE